MKYVFLLTLAFTLSFCDVFSMNSFEADFSQKVTNDKGNTIEYNGHIKALKPQYAFWKYSQPITKFIYINKNEVSIIEPDLEQVITKKIHNSIDFFNIIKSAKKIDNNTYETTFQSVLYTIHIKNSILKSFEYKDQLDNKIIIDFTKAVQNKPMSPQDFQVDIPPKYDLIQG